MTRRLLAALATALLAGCTAGPDYRPPAVLTGATPAPELIEGATAAYKSDPLPPGWWRLYADATLDGLVDKALTRNTDLRMALATLEQTEAQLREQQLQRTPQTMLMADPTYGQQSADSRGEPMALKPRLVIDAQESVSYDLDLNGQLRRGIEAARADVGANLAALDLARVNIAARTTQAYSNVCAYGLLIDVTNRSIKVASDNLYLAQRRFAAGLNGSNDVVRARTLLRQTTAMLPGYQAQRKSALYMLATLTGDPPEAVPPGVVGCVAPPVLRRPIPIGDGQAMLKRRPDIRQAERRLASAVAEIGVSTADLYPSVSLMGVLGTTATPIQDVFKDRGFRWNVGPVLNWTFPNTAIARARIAASDAAARAALASFDGTILTGLRETESALVTLARALDTETDERLARDDAALALRNTNRIYAAGVGQFIDSLDAARTLIQAETTLAQTTAMVSQDQVTLFMALGGGWEGAPPVAETRLDAVTAPHAGAKRRQSSAR